MLVHNSFLHARGDDQKKQQCGCEGHTWKSLEVHIQILIKTSVKVHNLMGPQICETKHNQWDTLLNSWDFLLEDLWTSSIELV
jgi:hypothetical protein